MFRDGHPGLRSGCERRYNGSPGAAPAATPTPTPAPAPPSKDYIAAASNFGISPAAAGQIADGAIIYNKATDQHVQRQGDRLVEVPPPRPTILDNLTMPDAQLREKQSRWEAWKKKNDTQAGVE